MARIGDLWDNWNSENVALPLYFSQHTCVSNVDFFTLDFFGFWCSIKSLHHPLNVLIISGSVFTQSHIGVVFLPLKKKKKEKQNKKKSFFMFLLFFKFSLTRTIKPKVY